MRRPHVLALVLVLGLTVVHTARADARRRHVRRGVAPIDHHRFTETHKTFQCDDASTVISIDRVNDEYCDCVDGSDEPGTSACAGRGNDRGFYCVNAGGVATRVPASRVDDGVCDCCDGSDEDGEMGSVKCANTCGEEARARREGLMKTLREATRGERRRAKEADKARGRREEWKRERDALEEKIGEKRKRVDELLREAEEAEAEERKIREEEEAKRRTLEEMKSNDDDAPNDDAPNDDAPNAATTTNGNDEGDFENGRPTEETTAGEDAGEIIGETDEERGKRIASQWISNDDAPSESAEETGEDDGNDAPIDARVDEGDAEDVVSSGRSKLRSMFDRARRLLKPSRDEALAAQASKRRDAHDAARRELDDMNTKLDELRAKVDRDYGPDDVLISLSGQCFEQKIDKYTYSACPFGEAKQDDVRLGKNVAVRVDDATGSMTLKFENGEGCWNGPSRSLALALECSDENRLASIEEPSRCEYAGVFHTPFACSPTMVSNLENELAELDRVVAAASRDASRDEL